MIAHRSLLLLAALSVLLVSRTALADCGCSSACGQACAGAACGQGCARPSCAGCAPAMVARTVMTPEYVAEVRKVKVVECSCETRERRYTVCQLVPETRTIDVNYTVMVPETRTRTETYCVSVPVTRTVTQEYQRPGPLLSRGQPAVLRLRSGMERRCPAVHRDDAAHGDAPGRAANDPLRSRGGDMQRHRGSRALGNCLLGRMRQRVLRWMFWRVWMRLAAMGPQLCPRACPTDGDEAGMLCRALQLPGRCVPARDANADRQSLLLPPGDPRSKGASVRLARGEADVLPTTSSSAARSSGRVRSATRNTFRKPALASSK